MFDLKDISPEMAKFTGTGPSDCKWPDEQPITAITIQKPTSFDGEAMQVAVPVYKGDTLEDLKARVYMFLCLGDERMTEKNNSLIKAAEIEKAEKEKKAFEAQVRSATLVAAKKAAKKGDLAAVEAIAGGAHDTASNHSGSAQPS